MRVFAVILFLLITQTICWGAVASVPAAAAPLVFKIEFDSGITLKGSKAALDGASAKGALLPEIALDKPIATRLNAKIQAALDALMRTALAQRLITNILHNKNVAIKQHFTSIYLGSVPQILDVHINALITKADAATGSPTRNRTAGMINSAITSNQAKVDASRDHPLILLLTEHIAQDNDEISADLSRAIESRIQELQTTLNFPDYPAIWPLFIAQFVHDIIGIAIAKKAFIDHAKNNLREEEQKTLDDAIIFCLFVDPKLVIGRFFNKVVSECSEAIQQAADDRHIYILVKNYKTCFADIKEDQTKLAIKLNIEDVLKGPAINVLQRNATKHYLINGEGDYLLCKEDSDLTALLMHELIHMSHFVEDPKTFERDRVSTVSRYWAELYDNVSEFSRLWQDVEEQRTVIGRQGFRDDISELSVRMQLGMPIRYPYLSVDDPWVSKEIIRAIVLGYALPSQQSP